MLSLSDAFAVLPGGLGTLDEFFEVITAVQLQVFDKPIVLLDSHGFFAPLEALIARVVAQGFAGAAGQDVLPPRRRRRKRRWTSSQSVCWARRARRRAT